MNKKEVLVIIIMILIVVGAYFFFNNSNKEVYESIGNAFSYSSDREKVDYNKVLIEENKTFNIYKVDFDTRQFLDENIRIYGLFFVPKNNENEKTNKKANSLSEDNEEKEKIPSVIFLPGGGGTKESRREIGEFVVGLGYGILIIDQRGLGETKGQFLDFRNDYEIFSNKQEDGKFIKRFNKEPMQHLAVYDILRSFDFLREIKEIDEENIAVVGESMGGRYGIIAAAIDKRIKGVIGISTSGFHIDINPLTEGNNYMVSIDVDNYIKKISPRNLFMLHCKDDNIVKLEDAKKTFAIAKEPKKFQVFENCIHGYNNVMKEELKEDLKEIF